MAAHNLWTRRSRTAFNTFGIIVSCSLLLLVMAGTRGARDGLINLFEQSEFATKLAILPGRMKTVENEPPKEKLQLESGIAPQREARLREKLEKEWERKNLPRTKIGDTELAKLRDTSPLISVLPTRALSCQLDLEGQKVAARIGCFSLADNQLIDRVIAGSPPKENESRNRIWIDEFRAYEMGFRTDEELETLVGKRVKLRFKIAAASLPPNLKRMASMFGLSSFQAAEIDQIADALRKLFAAVDDTDLNDLEKQIVRSAAEKMGLGPQPEDSETKTDAKNEPFIYRDFLIAGIVKPPEISTSSIFTVPRANQNSELLIDFRDHAEIHHVTNPNHTHFYCIATVKSPTDLEAAVDAVENQGFETRSAIGILQRADEELWKVRLIVAALALVIMLIASVGIMNTMIIAVMERTPEFGIMKAVGANDSDIRRLMLLEAALTGVLGVAISLILVRIVDGLASGFARQYIESRLKEDFEFSVFVYSLSDTLIVVAIAIAVCTLASLIPSNRAAKLDPVVAMRSR